MAERLANKIKQRRGELGLTLAIKLAQALGLSVEQLFWIER
jgi:transcriptional regulator with XRE-family HTH domain